MTDHGGAASPRTDLAYPDDPAMQAAWERGYLRAEKDLAAQEAPAPDHSDAFLQLAVARERIANGSDPLVVLDGMIDDERHALRAAQEAPAPEWLRAALLELDWERVLMIARYGEGPKWLDAERPNPWRTAVEPTAKLVRDTIRAALAAAPSTPAEPPRCICTPDNIDPRCEHPDHRWEPGVAPADYGAEARPPEGLDTAWAVAEAALPDGWHGPMLTTKPGWAPEARWAARAYWTGHGATGAEGTGPTPAAALLALAARLSAGGATKPPAEPCPYCGGRGCPACGHGTVGQNFRANRSAGGATKP